MRQIAEYRGLLTVIKDDTVAQYEQIKSSTYSTKIRAHISHILIEPQGKPLDENELKVSYRLRRAVQRKARACASEPLRSMEIDIQEGLIAERFWQARAQIRAEMNQDTPKRSICTTSCSRVSCCAEKKML